jgi:Calcium-dependent channel, 7TM region, putative phosphate
LESPKEFITLLATALPQQSVFFMQLLIVSTTVGTLNELFRVVPIFYSIVRAHIGRRLTEKERNEKVGMFRALSNVDKCYYSRLHSAYLLYFIVLYVYTTISPLVNWFCLIFFCFVGSVYRHQFVYNYPKTPDSGGKIWLQFMEILLACMVIALLTIGGFLGLKKATIALPLLIPLLGATIYFIIYVRRHHFLPGRFLATSSCIAQDAANKDRGANYNEFSDEYKQPMLKVRFLDVDWNARHSMDKSHSDRLAEGQASTAEKDDEENVKNLKDECPGDATDCRRSLGPRELLVRIWSLR